MTITRVTDNHNNTATGSTSVTTSSDVSVGDLLLTMLFWDGINVDVTPTVADNFNSGLWNLPAAPTYYSSSQLIRSQVAWIRCDTAILGTANPTVTASNLGTQGNAMVVAQFTGFATGNPALVSADVLVTNGGTGSTSPSSNLASNSAAPELMIMWAGCRGGQNFGSFTGGMTMEQTGNADNCYGFQVVSSTGNAINWGATIASATWATIMLGFSDQPPNSASIGWVV